MKPWLRLYTYRIDERQGYYRLHQLASWRNITNYFVLPFYLGVEPRWIVLDKTRVDALRANGAIRVLLESSDYYKHEVASIIRSFKVIGVALILLLVKLIGWNFPQPISDTAHALISTIVMLGFLGIIVAISIRKRRETKLLKQLGLWGEFAQANQMDRQITQEIQFRRVQARSTLRRNWHLFAIILTGFAVELGRSLGLYLIFERGLNIERTILLILLSFPSTFIPLLMNGYPSKWLFIRRNTRTS